MANRNFPVVSGLTQLTKKWSLDLPGEFNRRIEDEQLVMWRPGLTFWISVWNSPSERATTAMTVKMLRDDIGPSAYDLVEDQKDGLIRIRYRLMEHAEDKRLPALYGFLVADDGYLQFAAYFDREEDEQVAQEVFESVHFCVF